MYAPLVAVDTQLMEVSGNVPNYEYICKDCNATEEHYRKVDDRDNFPNCQHCGNVTARTITPTPIKFNGSGFYSTGG